ARLLGQKHQDAGPHVAATGATAATAEEAAHQHAQPGPGVAVVSPGRPAAEGAAAMPSVEAATVTAAAPRLSGAILPVLERIPAAHIAILPAYRDMSTIYRYDTGRERRACYINEMKLVSRILSRTVAGRPTSRQKLIALAIAGASDLAQLAL